MNLPPTTPARSTRTVTIKDVAREAGVALGTVSRILNGHENVDSALREKVLQVIGALGYSRNATARSMRIGKTLAVGCIVSDIRMPVAAAMVTSAEIALRDAGYAMIVANTHYEEDREAEIMAFMRERAVDGLLMIVNRDADASTAKRLKALNIPIVLWERDAGGALDCVVTEHRQGTHAATEHLLSLGHRRILLIAGHPQTWVGREQAAGLHEALGQVGAPVDEIPVFQVGQLRRKGLAALLDKPDRPSAIIANINEISNVLSAAADVGLAVPKNLSVVSIGDSDFLQLTSPPITAVTGSPETLGTIATELLIERLITSAPHAAKRISIPMRFQERASTAPVD